MSRAGRDRASRLSEFREAHAAYRETGSLEHAEWRERAMRSRDVRESDFKRAAEAKVETVVSDKSHVDEVLKKAGFTGWKKENGNG